MKLYDKQTEFRIYDTNGVVLSAGAFEVINEPKDYAALEMKLERIIAQNGNPRHGFNFEYGDPETPIIFVRNSGYELLQQIFDVKGTDSQVRFEFGVYEPTYSPKFIANLDFNTYERAWVNGIPRIKINLEAESIIYKLNSRLETKVNLLTDKNFDGGSITPLQMESHYFHSKVIRQLHENGFEREIIISTSFQFNPYRIFINTEERENETFFIANLDSTVNTGKLVSMSEPIYSADAGGDMEDYPLLIVDESGFYQLDIQMQIYFVVEFFNLTSETSKVNLEMSLVVVNEGDTVATEISNRNVLDSKESGNPIEIDGNYLYLNGFYDENAKKGAGRPAGVGAFTGSWSSYLEKGQRVYLIFRYFHNPAENDITSNPRRRNFIFVVGNTTDIEEAQSFIKLQADTTTPAERVNVIELPTAMNRLLEVTTGLTNPLISSFYQSGCGEKRWITNGFQLRQFEVDDRSPETSVSDMIDSVQMIDAIGMGFEKDGNDIKIRVEPFNYFYKDAEILTIDKSVIRYEEKIADDIILSEVILQFNKFIDEELNTLDSFNTRAEWLTPIFTKSLKLELISKYIADGYAIEYTRREQFKATANDSWRYDDDIFIVDYVDIVGLSGANAIDILPMPEGRFLLAGGTTVEIQSIIPELVDLESFILNSNTYTVNLVEFDLQNQLTFLRVDETFPSFTVGSRLTFAGGFSFKRPETRQAFSTVNNLISPSTAYNLRMSMRRILQKHALWLNSGLNWKGSSEQILNTFYAHNKSLQTQLATYVTCRGGDPSRVLMNEDGNITLGDLLSFGRLFVPIRVEYEAELSFEQNEYLRKALSGQSPDDNNYGYVRILNEDGEFTKVFINLHTYKPITSLVEGWGYKKFE
jgi:hypothetical protein